MDLPHRLRNRLEEPFYDVRIFFRIGAARNNAIFDKPKIHLLELLDPNEFAKAFLLEQNALRRSDHRARDVSGAERCHGFRNAAGLNDGYVADLSSLKNRQGREMGARADSAHAHFLSFKLRDFRDRRLHVQWRGEGLGHRRHLDDITALEDVGNYGRAAYSSELRFTCQHRLDNQG